MSLHKQFGATEIASDAEKVEIMKLAYGYKEWRRWNLNNSEMGPSTGQTLLGTSVVVSLVSEELEEMAQWGQWKAL